jgi:hypothetical protein
MGLARARALEDAGPRVAREGASWCVIQAC